VNALLIQLISCISHTLFGSRVTTFLYCTLLTIISQYCLILQYDNFTGGYCAVGLRCCDRGSNVSYYILYFAKNASRVSWAEGGRQPECRDSHRKNVHVRQGH
jgi:hypothetical protein